MADEPAPLHAESKPGDLRGVLPAGTMLRGYELKSILGQGAFGITYRARDLTLGRDVAIKEYLPTTLALREGRTTVLPRSPEHAEQFNWGRERFLDEARTLAKLDRTPAIVRVHDFLEDNGTAYMVMGLVEGENLNKRLLREGRLTPEAVERLLLPLLDGLEEVHAIGFLHRDIKPANVMVDARGRPTLIDFGAARAAMAGRSTTMTAIFTPGYAAAEQYTSASLGPWTDIYGVAATMAHAITGKIPPSSIERIIKDTYVPLSELKPEGFSPELLAGIDAGMARQVDDRPQSIAEWRHVLRTGEHRASSQEVTQVEFKPRRRTRKAGINVPRPLLWSAIAAAVIVLAGGGWVVFTAGSPPTVGAAATSLSAEQLEQALAERRKADTFAAEKRKLEEEARQKAQADAEAKRQAESELEQARQARQKAEQELAELKARIAAGTAQAAQQDQAAVAAQRDAEEAAQRKAEADAAALRQVEEDAKRRLEAEAEAKRQADEALAKLEAERQKAEQDARAKADAEQAALRRSSEEAQRKAAEAESVRRAEAERQKAEAERAKAEAERQKAEAEAKVRAEAETAEKALRLEQADRQRLQVALTSLGFDTRGNDGVFGPRSREMITGWQKKAGAPATGFLSAAQRDQLLHAAAPAVARWDEEQKKIEEQKKAEDDKKKSDAAQAVATAAPSSAPPGRAVADPPATALLPSAFDGTYTATVRPMHTTGPVQTTIGLTITNGRGSFTMSMGGCSSPPIPVTISSTGELSGRGDLKCPFPIEGQSYLRDPTTVRGRVADGKVTLTLASASTRGDFTATLSRGSQAVSAGPALPSPDGLWRGTYACTVVSGTGTLPSFALDLNLKLVNGISSGGGFTESGTTARTLNIEVAVNPPKVTVTRFYMLGTGNAPVQRQSISGQFDGTSIHASGRQFQGNGTYECTLALTRVP
jgi:serine/threonine protein kinase/peptidoglycan hydrolase-like protein with peptidoglycan-binding domain